MRFGFLCLVLLIIVASVDAQTERLPEFEVATVKAVPPSPPGQPININLGTIRNGRVTLNNVTLSDCIKFAYNMVSDAQVIGPDWITTGDIRFEVVAQAPPETPEERVRLMLQSLLSDRLKLEVHRDKKELPYFALVVGKNGHKLTPPKDTEVTPRTGAGRISTNRMRMPVLAMLLSRFERAIVLDQTDLQGQYAIELQWTTDAIRRLAPPDGGLIRLNGEQIDPNGPTLYTAIQEQLGLRLDARKGPVEVIVIDRAEKVPAEN
jgi:uncharacterized protein (TIGR03435 family)